MHFAPRRKETIYFILITKLSSKCNGGIMRFDGKLHKYLLHRGQSKTKLWEIHMLSHEVQTGAPCLLNSFSEYSWIHSKFKLAMFGFFCVNDDIHTICPLNHLSKITKFHFTYSQFTYWVSDSIRNLSHSENNLERCPCSRGDPGMQPMAMKES